MEEFGRQLVWFPKCSYLFRYLNQTLNDKIVEVCICCYLTYIAWSVDQSDLHTIDLIIAGENIAVIIYDCSIQRFNVLMLLLRNLVYKGLE